MSCVPFFSPGCWVSLSRICHAFQVTNFHRFADIYPTESSRDLIIR